MIFIEIRADTQVPQSPSVAQCSLFIQDLKYRNITALWYPTVPTCDLQVLLCLSGIGSLIDVGRKHHLVMILKLANRCVVILSHA